MATEANRFGSRLRELRTAAGLTQPALAEKAALTKDGVAQLEQGRRSPSWETVLALATALGVDCSAFTEEPIEGESPPGRGRPKKDAPSEAVDAPAPKKRKPKKG